MSGRSEPTELIARKESANIIAIFYSAIAFPKIKNPLREQNKNVIVQPSGHIVDHFINAVDYTHCGDNYVYRNILILAFGAF